jgi:hypothetical protein
MHRKICYSTSFIIYIQIKLYFDGCSNRIINLTFFLLDENTILAFSLDDSVSDIFDISSNGTISTKKSLDRESIPFYAFQVS